MTMAAEVSDEEVLARYPDIAMDHDTKDYWKGCLKKQLLIDRCQKCGEYIHLPKPICPKCWSPDVVATQVSGNGTLFSITFLYQEGGGTPDKPNPIATVELVEQERLRMTATLVNCSKEDMRIGMPVEVTWIDYKGAPVPAFQPRKA